MLKMLRPQLPGWCILIRIVVLIWFWARDTNAEAFGVNWGNIARQPLPPGIVVKMLQDNNITRVKLFDADYNTLKALAGSNIEVMVAAPNDMLKPLAASEKAARDWVRANVTHFLFDGGVNIKYVAVGNEPFLIGYNGSYQNVTFPALKNIQKALVEAGHEGKVHATIPFNADVLCGSTVDCASPSQGVFRPDISELMIGISAFLNRTGAPFTLNIYPFLSLALTPNFPLEYAFFDNFTLVDQLTGFAYTNTFDASYDTLVAALNKTGFPNMHIIIGEIGWPTDGNQFATSQYAQKFNNQAMAHLKQRKGTPLRPNMELDVYLFGLLDENLKSVDPGSFERHWGIFYYDGNPKYALDFSGQGDLNSWPKPAVGVEYLEPRWCIVNPSALVDPDLLATNVEYACQRTDCSALQPGGSCFALDTNTKASYAFNNYYQFNYQDKHACDFDDLATLVSSDPSPSVRQCRFPVALNYKPLRASGSGSRSRFDAKSSNTAFAVVVISVFLIYL